MYNSKYVDSNQAGVHQRLLEVVQKHLVTDYLKPYQEHNLAAFNQVEKEIHTAGSDTLILDSCCGTGMSTWKLAIQNPDCLVVGIDQSYKRLNKNKPLDTPKNCLILQANCEDIWRLCLDNHIHFDHHYLLYPNPYPKSTHLKKRWHGHPVFPCLKPLAKKTIVRSNWLTYLDEFKLAWQLLTKRNTTDICRLTIEKPLTLFEKKYYGSGQVLYELIVES